MERSKEIGDERLTWASLHAGDLRADLGQHEKVSKVNPQALVMLPLVRAEEAKPRCRS